MSLATGAQVGRYEVVSVPGAGGMGEVYRARDRKLQRDVALKILPAAFVAEPIRARGVQPITVIVNWPARGR
jgi:eukaryotic-like serine/threonine-protein kinase